MKEAKSRTRSNVKGRASGELRVVAIHCNPAPDAEDRLRRLMSLMIKYATQDGQTGHEHDRLQDEPDAGAEAEA